MNLFCFSLYLPVSTCVNYRGITLLSKVRTRIVKEESTWLGVLRLHCSMRFPPPIRCSTRHAWMEISVCKPKEARIAFVFEVKVSFELYIALKDCFSIKFSHLSIETKLPWKSKFKIYNDIGLLWVTYRMLCCKTFDWSTFWVSFHYFFMSVHNRLRLLKIIRFCSRYLSSIILVVHWHKCKVWATHMLMSMITKKIRKLYFSYL